MLFDFSTEAFLFMGVAAQGASEQAHTRAGELSGITRIHPKLACAIVIQLADDNVINDPAASSAEPKKEEE